MNFKDAYKAYNDDISGNREILSAILSGDSGKRRSFNYVQFVAVAAVLVVIVAASFWTFGSFNRGGVNDNGFYVVSYDENELAEKIDDIKEKNALPKENDVGNSSGSKSGETEPDVAERVLKTEISSYKVLTDEAVITEPENDFASYETEEPEAYDDTEYAQTAHEDNASGKINESADIEIHMPAKLSLARAVDDAAGQSDDAMCGVSQNEIGLPEARAYSPEDSQTSGEVATGETEWKYSFARTSYPYEIIKAEFEVGIDGELFETGNRINTGEYASKVCDNSIGASAVLQWVDEKTGITYTSESFDMDNPASGYVRIFGEIK